MATKHIFSKAITTGIVGAIFLPIVPDAEATFIGDEVNMTLDIAGDIATKTHTASAPESITWFYYPGDFSTSTAPVDVVAGEVYLPAGTTGGTDFRFNFGISDMTGAFGMTLTVSDIDWMTDAVPHEIVSVSGIYGNATSITTGADSFSVSFSVPYTPNDPYYTATSGFDLVWRESTAPVPEPATITLLGIGLAGLAFTRKYKKRKL